MLALSQQDSETVAGVTAAFSRYLKSEMDRLNLKQTDIARRGRIKKQLVHRIYHGVGGDEPSALAVAGVARALEVEPSEVLRGIGLWDGPPLDPIPDEAAFVYRQLDQTQRKTLVSVARVLREAQHEYDARLRVAYIQGQADVMTDVDGVDPTLLNKLFPNAASLGADEGNREAEGNRDISEGDQEPP